MKIFIIQEIEEGYTHKYIIENFYNTVKEAREELRKLKLSRPYKTYLLTKEIKK